MTDGFIWGGFNIRKFCRLFLRNFWMVIAIMIITYLGLGFVDKQTYTPQYTSAAVAAVYPVSSSYRYHTIENTYNLSSKTEDMSAVFNSDLFKTGLYDQDPSLQDCAIDCYPIANTDLLVMHGTSGIPKNAFEGIQTAIEYYSRFSGNMTGAPEIRVILGPEAPYLDGDSKIRSNRARLCILSGLLMAGLLFLMYVAKTTYKTERCIRRRYKNVRFFSLPITGSRSGKKNGISSKNNSQELIKRLAIEIKQVLKKSNKKTLLATSYADHEGGTAVISELARELAEQNEKVILIETEVPQHDSAPGLDLSDDMKKYSLLDVLQQKCTVKDAMLYKEELKVHCIQLGIDSIDVDFSYSAEDVRRVLSDCRECADIVLVNGTAWFPSQHVQIWHEAVDASIALCRQDDADFFKVDNMLNDLQKSNTYFAGCVLLGF